MQEKKRELEIICMGNVESQEVQWLWYPYIPYGKITIVQGDPGEGKTTFVLNLAARLSNGLGFEDEKKGESIRIIYQTAEDGLADTVKPRLEAAKADCTKILVIDESSQGLTMTDERIEEALKRTGAKMLILDPIQAYLGQGMDMNRANEARDITKQLGALAERTGCAIILIGHMNKSSASKAAYRGIGSVDFFAVARSVLLVARIENQPTTRVVAQIKNNLAEEGKPVAFELSAGGFRWIGDYDITVDELLGGYMKNNKVQQGERLIRELAEKHEKVPATDIFKKAEQQGISERTMKTVKKKLDIDAIRSGNIWFWNLQKIQ